MKALRILMVMAAVVIAMAALTGQAMAGDKVLVKGKIVSYDLDEATVTVKTDGGKEMTFVIENDAALFKLDDRLFEGDEVKIKYTSEGGKNRIREASDMKGTKPGC